MRVLIDILHPAHVHVFRNFIRLMEERGHAILVTARNKDVTLALLDAYGIPFVSLSTISKHKVGLPFEWLFRTFRLWKAARRFKPDVLLGCMGPSIVPVGKLLRKPTVVFYNNETAGMVSGWVQRIATVYVTSTSFEGRVKGRHVTHHSYHELAYLHPTYFTPDKRVLSELGIGENERFCIVRFVAWQASHDVGARGIVDKIGFVTELAKHGRVVITSEKNLPVELQTYQIKIKLEKLHDLLAFAALCVGESATLAAEAACLGVPAIYIANTMRGYTNELERDYGLVFNFSSQEEGLKKAAELVQRQNVRGEFQKKREKMLSEKIDLTAWMVKFVEGKNWESLVILR